MNQNLSHPGRRLVTDTSTSPESRPETATVTGGRFRAHICPGCRKPLEEHWAADALLAVTLEGKEHDQLACASAQNAKMRAAILRFIARFDKYLETGVPATPEESKSIYDQLKAAIQ